MGSSKLLEFIVALVVGILAVLGALFCIAFLLVEPVRFPPSEEPTVSLGKSLPPLPSLPSPLPPPNAPLSPPAADVLSNSACEPVMKQRALPMGCRLNGNRTVSMGTCSMNTCTCDRELLTQRTKVCCCRATEEAELVDGLECPMSMPFRNATACGCVGCDTVPVDVAIKVLVFGSRDPIPAAHVFLQGTSSADDITFLGITDNFGRFTTRRSASELTLTLVVKAVGYGTQVTSPFNLAPSMRRITRDILLVSTMDMVVGMGGDAFNLRLGSMISISGAPLSFTDTNGDQYEDAITFRGIVVDVNTEGAIALIPGGDFTYYDSMTEQDVPFVAYVGFIAGFLDADGADLFSTNGLQMSVSLQDSGEELPNLFFLTFDAASGRWIRRGDFTLIDPFRKKRQANPVIFTQAGECWRGVRRREGGREGGRGRGRPDEGEPNVHPFLTVSLSRYQLGCVHSRGLPRQCRLLLPDPCLRGRWHHPCPGQLHHTCPGRQYKQQPCPGENWLQHRLASDDRRQLGLQRTLSPHGV